MEYIDTKLYLPKLRKGRLTDLVHGFEAKRESMPSAAVKPEFGQDRCQSPSTRRAGPTNGETTKFFQQ
jgi:hypothetical protein